MGNSVFSAKCRCLAGTVRAADYGGTVLYNGFPVPNALVEFTSSITIVKATTGSDGKYRVTAPSATSPGANGTIAVSMLVGAALNFSPIDPIKALFWSAVINGVIAVPIMAMMMVLASSKRIMGAFTLSLRHRVLGWVATVVMLAAVLAMFGSWL